MGWFLEDGLEGVSEGMMAVGWSRVGGAGNLQLCLSDSVARLHYTLFVLSVEGRWV